MKIQMIESLKKIEAAVEQAETMTSGEIVPIIYDKCSNTSFVFPFTFMFLFLVWHNFQDWYFPVNFWEGNLFFQLGLPPLMCGAISLFLSRISCLQRLLIPQHRKEKNVRERAELEFYRSGVPQTKGRTGILIFVSLMERWSIILADEAISSKLPAETWREILNILNSQMSSKDLSRGIVPAIEKCGQILSTHFPRESQDVNELPNFPILRADC